MRLFSSFAIFALICLSAAIILVASSTTTSAALEESDVRCKVCQRAIEYVWHQGAELREHCQQLENHDPRCDYNQLHSFGIEEMVHEVCDKLPQTHQAIEGSEFDLVLKDLEKDGEPNHTEEAAAVIRNACLKWVHQEHSIKDVALYIFANLDANKLTKIILRGLVDRYCGRRACKAEYTQNTNIENVEQTNARYKSDL